MFEPHILGGFCEKNRGVGGNRGEKSGRILGGIPSPRPKPGVQQETQVFLLSG